MGVGKSTMTKNTIIALLVALLIWFGTALARTENERYALMLNMCPRHENNALLPPDCTGVQTRSNWAWHVVYALGIL